jgi:hypothetical protein
MACFSFIYLIDLVFFWGIVIAQLMLCGLIDKKKVQLAPPISTLILCKRLVKEYFNLVKG